MFRSIPLAALAAAVATSAMAAGPISEWGASELKDMDGLHLGSAVDGMTWEGTAPAGEPGKVDVVITMAGKYALVGSCGGDCTDIGLILDQGGKTVAQGVTGFRTDLQPGTYSLLVGFDNCKSQQCRYVVRAYQTKP